MEGWFACNSIHDKRMNEQSMNKQLYRW